MEVSGDLYLFKEKEGPIKSNSFNISIVNASEERESFGRAEIVSKGWSGSEASGSTLNTQSLGAGRSEGYKEGEMDGIEGEVGRVGIKG